MIFMLKNKYLIITLILKNLNFVIYKKSHANSTKKDRSSYMCDNRKLSKPCVRIKKSLMCPM